MFISIAFMILAGSAGWILAVGPGDIETPRRGLVPCGTETYPAGTIKNVGGRDVDVSGQVSNPCSICHIFTLLQNLLNFLWWYISIPLATLMLAYAGFLLMIPSLGSGSPPMITKGKKVLKNTVVGIIIVFFSWLFIDTIIKVLAGQELGSRGAAEIGEYGPWNKVNCDTRTAVSTPPSQTVIAIDGTRYRDGYPLTPAIIALSVPPEGTTLRNPSNTKCVLSAINPYSSLIDQAATQFGVSANRLRAIMMAESSGNPNAKSNDNDGKHSYGLM
ncbi:MAG: transglycosylase SLT domain-containing protein, partial [Patescibacteria group bacterium]